MKNILAKISIGTLAISAPLVVVSCSIDNDYRTFTTVLKNSKDDVLIVYAGSQNNASSKSFEKVFNSEIGKENNITASASSFNDTKIGDIDQTSLQARLKFSINSIVNSDGNESNALAIPFQQYGKVDVKNDKRRGWLTSGQTGENIFSDNLITNIRNRSTQAVKFHSLVSTNIESTWSRNSIMDKITRDVIIPSYARQLYSINTEWQDDSWGNTNIQTANDYIKKLDEAIRKLTGPIFMIFFGGEILSVFNGFDTFTEFANADQNTIDDNLNSAERAVKQTAALESWIDFLRAQALNSVINSYDKTRNNTSLIVDSSEAFKTYDKGSKIDSNNRKELATSNFYFNLDIKKYLKNN